MDTLDETDRRILAALQKNNRISNLELASRVHLSSPTCMRRVRRLREKKIIVADVSIIDPDKIGNSISVILEIILDRQEERMQKLFERKMLDALEVTQCYMVSGKADFILIAHFEDMSAYHDFIRRVITSDSNIRNFKSQLIMNRSKFTTEVHFPKPAKPVS